MQTLLLIVALIGYCSLGYRLHQRLAIHWVSHGGVVLLLHGLALGWPWFTTDLWNGNVRAVLSLCGLGAMLMAMILPTRRLLACVLVPVNGFLLLSMGLWSGQVAPLLVHSPWLALHIGLSLAANIVLLLAMLQALLALIQHRALRGHQSADWLLRWPSLWDMEVWLFRLIMVGFLLLSLTLFSGLFVFDDLFAQHLVHKTLLALMAWLIFAVLVWGRWQFGWRGVTALRWVVGGFIVLALAYFGSNVVLQVFLDR